MHSLYRKYRPQLFSEVLGQEHVVKSLKAALDQEQPAHAYLFSGGRGIGKTSLARIFARELGVSEKDVYEIDAASHNGVDEVRALREGAVLLPLESKYKVYVLDEVHMLSKGAFNALLKIIEEPPQHVIFILATTDIHKVPETIISRCEVYRLERPTRTLLTEMVERICKKEGVSITKDVATTVAELGDGSFRDTLSVLQQLITAADGAAISDELVAEQCGSAPHVLVSGIITAWAKKDSEEALRLIQHACDGGTNIDMLYLRILEIIRAIVLTRITKNTIALKGYAPHVQTFIETYAAEQKGSSINSLTLKSLLAYAADIKRSPHPHMLLELVIIETCSPQS
jgi:DNA polymerase III subunit gamma/tau